jgi:hypothetical protein
MEVALMPTGGDFSFLYGLKYGAARLTGVTASYKPAVIQIWDKFPKSFG